MIWTQSANSHTGRRLCSCRIKGRTDDSIRPRATTTPTFSLAWRGASTDGKQYFYHLVTDASAAVPAVLERGVVAPKLAKIPQFGESLPGEKSALLGFSPVLNGRTDKGSGEDQGFSTALANGVDPINVFPTSPDNDKSSRENNYSPLWDAHVSMWTQAAIDAGKAHRIHSMDEQKSLIREGLLTSASINPPGSGNPYVGGLRPTQAIINCPVIAHPDLPPQ